jgi:hypothetical protein
MQGRAFRWMAPYHCEFRFSPGGRAPALGPRAGPESSRGG